ncbi:hypothetical protein U0035_14855 [Niabella yanshanensis]|uniref:DUF5107 domain-containing protein n=1 Tax=Niabella yanshanensis TaxID=577386 RepID=A0ABZ0W113_9BACT|nr:hypothetical protein [Niabella yanshanensis]WQD36950.1 hypothetical protein U0035_14855 [Niabella yanshanensis]
MKKLYTVLISCICFLLVYAAAGAQNWKELATPQKGTKWVRPSQGTPAQPVWGHSKGLQVGLSPFPGPRGLLRIYTPYLGHKEAEVMNFIAFEPIVKGDSHRGLSELEMSKLDNQRGKRFWSANDSLSTTPVPENAPATGIIEKTGGTETLTVYIFSEPFDNGATVYTRLRFYEHQPYEVEITTYAAPGSRALEHFIVTATMGNYARLRNLYLQPGTVSPQKLWPDYREDGFTPHAHFSQSSFIKDRNGRAYFIAAPDEKNPSEAIYANGTNDHWKYYGQKATQYWYSSHYSEKMEGLVNGRYTYWASQSPIPEGIAYENFELKAPFAQGNTYVFGVSPLAADKFVKNIKNKRK